MKTKVLVFTLICFVGLLAIPLAAGKRSTPTLYTDTCSICHDTGISGALKKGDSSGWKKLIAKKGMVHLVTSVKKGVGAMPAKGLCNNCSDAEIKALILFMAK